MGEQLLYAAAKVPAGLAKRAAHVTIGIIESKRKEYAEKAEAEKTAAIAAARQRRRFFSSRLVFPPDVPDEVVWSKIFQRNMFARHSSHPAYQDAEERSLDYCEHQMGICRRVIRLADSSSDGNVLLTTEGCTWIGLGGYQQQNGK